MPKIAGASSTKMQIDISFVKNLRKSFGYKPHEFAKIINVDRSTYAKKENGKVPLSLQEWIMITDFLKPHHHVTFNISGSFDSTSNHLPVISPATVKQFPVLEKVITEANEASKTKDTKLLIKIMEYAIDVLSDTEKQQQVSV